MWKHLKLSEFRFSFQSLILTSFLAILISIYSFASPKKAQQYDVFTNNEVIDRVERGFVRWEVDEIKIGFNFGSTDLDEIMRQISSELKSDQMILEKQTGIKITLGLWGDQDPKPRIFLLIADKRQILEQAPFISETFKSPDFESKLHDHIEETGGGCFSLLKFDGQGEIKTAFITVDHQQSPSFCLRKQLLNAFGLVGRVSGDKLSVLHDSSPVEFYSDLDQKLLFELYNQ